ncbi:NAD(P)/FAD-dependent oxidoreductase [Caballeronia sordidicola]|uniref:NAD(P)/FAD-dependent oxidoreductase n=1 Tax=Caballeronia sordidicola TaxID=196367 RepID=UPI001ABF46DF|nr:FAD-dependent oxidoreductase [Caballeronia sordidicola]
MSTADSFDFAVIGGGLVGTSLAYGLARRDRRVVVLDEGDDAFRAARGNFGLVWVQSKGYQFAPYASWTRQSSTLWPMLAQSLYAETGVDVQLQQRGAFHLCFTEADIAERVKRLEWVRSAIGGDYPFEILKRDALKARLPQIGPDVFGAAFSPMDGHVNPLKLLRALHTACQGRGVTMRNGTHVDDIVYDAGRFHLGTKTGELVANRIVLAAGLGNCRLAERVGLNAPVRPNRGQVLVTERIAPVLPCATAFVRQTDEGSIQIGDSMEDVGFDDSTHPDVLKAIAKSAVRQFPFIAKLRLVRAWGALRVMSPDGYPIYEESTRYPGAFLVTCHSGVTLAGAHALALTPWLMGEATLPDIDAFSGARFAAGKESAAHAH